jgi:hypothetical protein
MRKFIIGAVAAALTLIPSIASAQPWRGNDREVRQEVRECRRELRRADSRREYQRERRECRREISRAQRDNRHGWQGRGGDRYDRYRNDRQRYDRNRYDYR